jgi:hypothetical protein
MTAMTPKEATALRRPFPPESVGQLPKGGVMLDYVGHAAVTDRLLTVDPNWSWEPFAIGPDGLPALDRSNNLWIRLTVCGVTRIGVGDGKNAKEVIGDAIRNAAMRFGVALDLWAKENLVEFAQSASGQTPAPVEPPHKDRPATRAKKTPEDDPFYDTPPRESGDRQVSKDQLAKMGVQMKEAGITDRDKALLYVSDVVGRKIATRNDLTRTEASKVINALQADLEQPFPDAS